MKVSILLGVVQKGLRRGSGHGRQGFTIRIWVDKVYGLIYTHPFSEEGEY